MIRTCSTLALCLLGVGIVFGQGGLGYFSVRGPVATAGVVGSFTIGPEAPKRVLIRAIGPGLVPFGVTGTLADPRLEVRNASGEIVAANDNWGEATNASEVSPAVSAVGAFPVTAGSKDAVVLATLPPGAYTVAVSGVGLGVGEFLFEVYEAGVSPQTGFMAFGYEGLISAAGSNLIAGFGTPSGSSRVGILGRALGPSLGIGGIADPTLSLYSANGRHLTANDDVSNNRQLASAGTSLGVPALQPQESAVLVDLEPGNYLAVLSPKPMGVGRGKIELLALASGVLDSNSPVIQRHPVSSSTSLGGQVTLRVEVDAPSEVAYQWRRNGIPIRGATDAFLELVNVTEKEVGAYDVVISNAAGNRTSDACVVNVSGSPLIAVQPHSQSVQQGVAATIGVLASGTGPLEFQWFRNGVVLPGATSSTLHIDNVTQDDEGEYHVVVRSAQGVATSEPAALHVGSANLRAIRRYAVKLGVSGSGGIGSFTITPEAPKRVLLRALGPALIQEGQNGALIDPQLELRDAFGRRIAVNQDWGHDGKFLELESVFAELDASSLARGSRDAALLVDLPPGRYTVLVSGVGQGVGVVRYELIDADKNPISTFSAVGYEAQIGLSDGSMSLELTLAGSRSQDLLMLGLGPSLGAGGLADPLLTVALNDGSIVSRNDNWAREGNVASAARLVGVSSLADSESALISSFPAGSYNLSVASAAGASGRVRLEIHAIPEREFHAADADRDGRIGLLELTRIVELYNTRNRSIRSGAYEVASMPTEDGFEPAPHRDSALSVSLGRYHTADSNRDGRIGLLELTRVIELYNHRTAGLRTGSYSKMAGSEDGFRAGGFAYGAAKHLFLAFLRSPSSAGNVAFVGSASLGVSADWQVAVLRVNLPTLGSALVATHLAIDGEIIADFPANGASDHLWTLKPVGRFSVAEIREALEAGRVAISVNTASDPGGSLMGGFVRKRRLDPLLNSPVLPTIGGGGISETEASRFLLQASFGPTEAAIAEVRALGFLDWIRKQIDAVPASSHFGETMADFGLNPTVGGNGNRDPVTKAYQRPGGAHRQAAWWRHAVTAPDQLRQRVAFALSQILVVSDLDSSSVIAGRQEAVAQYYDVLVAGAFGSFRELLEKVSLSPIMGIYLNSLRSAKATVNAAGQITSLPDENYAKALLQLFTIGPYELNPDGTMRLDPSSHPVVSHTQEAVTQIARVFTGFSYANLAQGATANAALFRGSPANYSEPMMLWPAFHDDATKVIVGGRTLPAGQGGMKDLADTLDALAGHPNTGPFVSRKLIQRLVTSNPSPGYVYRVAQAFANNGTNVRGDLGAVVRAILLDDEARSPAVAAAPTFGKLKEPLLVVTGLLRAFGGGSNSGRFPIFNPEGSLGQAALRADSVFSFFDPNYLLPGPLAEAGLYAPEFNVLNGTTAITQPNLYYSYIYTTRSATDFTQQAVGLNISALLSLALAPAQLVDRVSLLLTGGMMPDAARKRIVTALNGLPAGTGNATFNDIERVRVAIYLTLTSPHGSVQR